MCLVSRRASAVAHKLAQPICDRTYELWHFAINIRENARAFSRVSRESETTQRKGDFM
jgi:hypothetical protein